MPNHSPLLPIILSLSLLGCSDYNFASDGDASEGDDTAWLDDSGVFDDPAICEDFTDPAAEAVSFNTECDVEYSEGSFTPITEWSFGTTSFCGPPAAGQIIDSNGSGAIDDDDMPVVVLYQSSRVVALWGDGSGVAWQNAETSFGQDGGFAIGDVTGDGWPDVITASSSQVCAIDGNTGTTHWCTTGLSSSLDPSGYSYPSIADMDGDGRAEVIIGRTILHGVDGVIRGQGSHGNGAAPYGGSGASTYGVISVVIDIDNDGTMEVITGNAAYAADGSTIWYNGGPDGLVAIADFDGDGQGEIVKTSGTLVTGLETDGSVAWGPLTYSGNIGTPAIDDLDGDGTPEFVFAAQNSLVAMEWGGSVLWTSAVSDASGAAGPTLFDFEMDGYPEVLYADEGSIKFFSGRDGSLKFNSNEHSSYTILETPIIADVDNDDQVEIILGHCSPTGSMGSVTVYGDADQTWPPGRKVWNQHAYAITNIENDGTVSTAGNNFALYNSFRSGDVGRPPSEYWDLRAEVLDVCDDECDLDAVYVQGRVSNAGNIEAPAGLSVSLRAGGGGPILDVVVTTGTVSAGSTGETVEFAVLASELDGARPIITVDEDSTGSGVIYECDESNNVAAWTEPVCP
ncbi:MAG: hypothetical protein ACI8RZ_000550 [Myxococcota bacterium]|jgi:hypothetical protein